MSVATALDPTKPAKPRTRKSGAQSPGIAGDKVPKSKDASLTKVSFYLPVETARKLTVASILRGKDCSDLAAEVLGREFSSVTFYEKPTRAAEQTLTVSEIGLDTAD